MGCVGVFEDDGVDVEEAWHSTSVGCALLGEADWVVGAGGEKAVKRHAGSEEGQFTGGRGIFVGVGRM